VPSSRDPLNHFLKVGFAGHRSKLVFLKINRFSFQIFFVVRKVLTEIFFQIARSNGFESNGNLFQNLKTLENNFFRVVIQIFSKLPRTSFEIYRCCLQFFAYSFTLFPLITSILQNNNLNRFFRTSCTAATFRPDPRTPLRCRSSCCGFTLPRRAGTVTFSRDKKTFSASCGDRMAHPLLYANTTTKEIIISILLARTTFIRTRMGRKTKMYNSSPTDGSSIGTVLISFWGEAR
jgi:hypothetical protein